MSWKLYSKELASFGAMQPAQLKRQDSCIATNFNNSLNSVFFCSPKKSFKTWKNYRICLSRLVIFFSLFNNNLNHLVNFVSIKQSTKYTMNLFPVRKHWMTCTFDCPKKAPCTTCQNKWGRASALLIRAPFIKQPPPLFASATVKQQPASLSMYLSAESQKWAQQPQIPA
jgi:hypothetical protein